MPRKPKVRVMLLSNINMVIARLLVEGEQLITLFKQQHCNTQIFIQKFLLPQALVQMLKVDHQPLLPHTILYHGKGSTYPQFCGHLFDAPGI